MDLKQELHDVGLSERWFDVLKSQVGVQTLKGLKYLGIESYPHLVQFINEPREKLALRKLLKMENSKRQSPTILVKKLLERKEEVIRSVKKLKQLGESGKYRQDEGVKSEETNCREMLQVPETMWLAEEFNLGDVIKLLEDMIETLEEACKNDDLNEAAFLTQVSGGLTFNLRGIVLKGVFVKCELRESVMLKTPTEITFNFSLRPPFTETKTFQSHSEEKEFLHQVTKFGCSAFVKVGKTPSKNNEAYFSTIKYWFIPMASCQFDDLRLSDNALSYLSRIDKNISDDGSVAKGVEKDCQSFFDEFGSHCLQGPFHFGGIFICKCFNSGFAMFDKIEEIETIQNEAIDAQMRSAFPQCFDETCVSTLKGISGPPRLTKQAHLQVITIGGPDRPIGFPDWKNALCASNKLWKLIDCGRSQVPVWDIILRHHQEHLKNPKALARTLCQCWRKSFSKDNSTVRSLHERVRKLVSSLKSDTYPETQLNMIVSKRKEVENQSHDPRLWATEFLPLVQNYICSIDVQKLEDPKIMSVVKVVVEPIDLGIIDEYPPNLQTAMQRVYGTRNKFPPLSSDYFRRFSRYFMQAFDIISSSSDTSIEHPHLVALGTSLIEKAVLLLREYLLKTGQCYEECLLLTILHPFEYNPDKRNFYALLSKKDMEVLSNHFVSWSYNFFRISQENQLQRQSYLMYLTVQVTHVLGAEEGIIESHIEFLQRKFRLFPEIVFSLENRRDWEGFQKQMKDGFREVASVTQPATMPKRRAAEVGDVMHHSPAEEQHASKKATIPQKKRPQSVRSLNWKSSATEQLKHPLMEETSPVLPETIHPQPQHTLELNVAKQTSSAGEQFRHPQVEEVHPRRNPSQMQKQATMEKSTAAQFNSPGELPKGTFKMVLDKVGLSRYFPQILSLRDAIQVREDVINDSNPILYPFIMLHKIMAFDSKCRVRLSEESSKSQPDSEEESDSEDESSEAKSLHPMDCLLALIHCSDNFLRQDLFSRLATCQIAVPLLLPHPDTRDPTLLMWAMRSIVKEFKSSSKQTYNGRIITYPTPFVSFLRLGHHCISKSEILNGIMNAMDSDNKNMTFFGYNSPGGTSRKLLADGLVEVSWYLPGDKLYTKPIAFTNLRGDACDPDLHKQVDFLCRAATMHVVLLSKENFEDGSKPAVIQLLQKLTCAQGGVIVVQTKPQKGFKNEVSKCLDERLFKEKVTIVKFDKSMTVFLESLQAKLRIKLEDIKPTQPSLVKIARKCHIIVDEDDVDCDKGRKLTEQLYTVIENFRKHHPRQSPKDLLPLQSEGLWHRWAALDKEQYRQRKKYHHEMREGLEEEEKQYGWTSKEYSEEQRKNMKGIRSRQYPLATKRNPVMSVFLSTLHTENKKVLHYFMIWLRFRLDDLSREILPPFYVNIRQKRKELSDIQKKHDETAEKRCQEELQALDRQLINASFGLEHLLRELGQIYEATTAENTESAAQSSESHSMIKGLPQIAAQLLCDGFPLELLDGDASHIPQKWISAVLNSLGNILKGRHGSNPSIYILSVLGVQSTGKSTLLNTVFGVQFSVSAGRCTRGAFMQLIPVHPSLLEKTGVHYFLLIDTEGLRAPELDRLASREHDNELATFVIGMANLTLINVSGEVSGDIDDILHTVVHAFLRMNQVQLRPSCHIIHQHVVAVGAEEKMMQGRLKTKDNLDKMTKAAAKETGVETNFTHFEDVIRFDHETDVSFFPDLWNGKPPMARVSSGYSEEAQHLKLAVIKNSATITKYSIPDIKRHLERLWKAILQEDFVFTFQNTFEIIAFKTLEGKYGDWSWSFKKDMTEWERMAEKELCGCTPEVLDDTHAKLLYSLQEFANEKHMKYEKIMLEYLNDSNNEIMLKWKPDMEPRLLHLCRTLDHHAEEHCLQVYQAQRDRAEADNEKGELSAMILGHIQTLIVHLGEDKMTNGKLMEIFDDKWDEWMRQLHCRMKPLKQPNIEKEVEISISESFKAQRKYIHAKLADPKHPKSLREWGVLLHLPMKVNHIQVIPPKIWGTKLLAFWSTPKADSFFPFAEIITTATLTSVQTHLVSMGHSDRNFSPTLVTELLKVLQEKKRTDMEEFQFTEEYDVDLALTCCGYAIKVFEEMAESFRRKHDPKMYVELEMKPQFRKIFMNMYEKVDSEKIFADTLCHQLEESVKDYVMERLPLLIVNEMRGTYPWIKDKQSFVANILLAIGEKLEAHSEDGFKLCIFFVTDPRASIELWCDHFVQEHCKSGSPSRLSTIAVRELNDINEILIDRAKQVTSSHEVFSTNEWQEFYCTELKGKINLSQFNHQMYIDHQEFSDQNFFTQEVIRGLNEMREKLKQNFSELDYPDILKREHPHSMIFDMVAGCTEQCPFCKAQCELTGENHSTSGNIKHKTQHRPQCLGGRQWESDRTMVLDVCTYSVSDSNVRFKTERSNWNWHPFSKYTKLYPEWTIPADKSLESSLYWKWFIGHYSSEIEDYFGRAKTTIPNEWKQLKWSEVKEWLQNEYHL